MMLPGAIHSWFIKYGIDPAIGWEALEVAAPRWDETDTYPQVEDEAELLGSMLAWVVGMIAISADAQDEQGSLLPLLQHVMPVTVALSPYLESTNRSRILEEADKIDGMHRLFQIALFGEHM